MVMDTQQQGIMKSAFFVRAAAAALAVSTATACASVQPGVMGAPASPAPVVEEPPQPVETLEEIMARTRAAVPDRPDLVQPSTSAGTAVWRKGMLARGLRILVSTESRALWLMRDTLVVFQAPIAVGMQDGFEYQGRRYYFETPVGQRRVQRKDSEPMWVPPDWHYFEIAVQRGLEAVQLRNGQRLSLSDGSRLEVRGRDVGRVNQFGNFYAFDPGTEIIFDGKVFIPPFGTRQRQVPEVLGPHRLVLGDGYLIHGTNKETSIGDAASHGCIRMYNEDVERLFGMVPVGTAVYIY
jgi:hypothetical protein